MNKLSVLTAMVFVINFTSIFAQEVAGSIKINGASEKSIELKSSYAVLLFKEFKEGKHNIVFSFKGDGYRKIESVGGAYPPQVPEFSFFKFKTTVKHNGKTVDEIEREPMPYLPGDMLLPAETFDFIHVLSTYKQDSMTYGSNINAMPKGKYEILLEAQPIEVDGKILRGIIQFNIK